MTPLGLSDILLLAAGFWLARKVARRILHPNTRETKLKGPPRDSWLFGLSRKLADAGLQYEQWAAEYGPVFQVPVGFGRRKIILCDPKAVNHFSSMERTIYVKTKMHRTMLSHLFGRGIQWAEGETHKRQRKALTPAFSNSAVRSLTSVFYDSAYKLRGYWDASIDRCAILDVENWMNRIALDSIGIGGFSHDFRSLDGEYSTVAEAFDALSFEGTGTFSSLVLILGTQLPFLAHLPTARNRILGNLRRTMNAIANDLLEKTKKSHEKRTPVSNENSDKSIISLLLKAQEEDGEHHMNGTEVVAQMNVLLVAGYETTAVSLTWALIELARNPEKQEKLRQELRQFGTTDPTWDQLVSGLPYLDAVVLEILRLHPPLEGTTREAIIDDVIPLGEPVTTPSGDVVSNIIVAKGSVVSVSIRCMNRSNPLWGMNAKEFQPERWLTLPDDYIRAKQIQGHRHLISFQNGPRTCLGKSFALAELKAVLSVLIRSFTFEFPNGPETKIETHPGIINRPKVVGQAAANVPMKVGRVD
ncbi:cytochrome P450 [Mycena belliarum]|uniref:Cytochrome P450 n=1 Tax=Mycena belliarum TaxID=1033014 RepID=A0AAD6TSC6_9AGAR|nr:cytochrome P450 [Mycena belliae]